jgi:periplasmic protein CpxP/Spy
MYKKIVGIVALTSSLLFSQGVLAHSWSCGKGMKEMVSDLKLNNDQKAKVDTIMSQLKANMKTTWSQMGDLEKQIHQQVISDKMDTSTLNGLVDQKAKLIGDNMKAKLTAQNQIMAVLTAEQKTTLQNKLQAREDKIAAKFKKCDD